MQVAREFCVKLVSPSVWRPLVAEGFGALTPREQRFARSVLMTMHNRHVGVTPELAAGLAKLLIAPHAQQHVGGAWGAVHQRLTGALSKDKTGSTTRSPAQERASGLLLGSIPAYSTVRLAIPIVEAACHQIGRCYLFCADQVESSVREDEYDDYAKALSNAMIQLADEKNDQLQLFWKDRAFALASLSYTPAVLGHSGAALPEAEPSALDLLLGLEPEKPPAKRHSRYLPRLAVPPGYRRNPRLKEGGIDGIRLSKRVEDVDGMLPIEYVYPRPIRVDRLLNTGFLATQRESKHDKIRDVLIAALMPWRVRARLSADFVKACWFDCVMRLSFTLCQYRLYQSEFRWIEGDTFDRVRTCTFLLQDMPALHTTFESGPSKAYRREFLKSLRWLPSYLDTRAHFSILAGYEEKTRSNLEATDVDRLKDWITSAWASQIDHFHWALRESTTDASRRRRIVGRRLKADEFAFVHVMLFLPADERIKELQSASLSLGSLYNALSLGSHPGRSVSVTWVPDRLDLEEIKDWAFDARGRMEALLFPAGRLQDDQKIAGRLEQTWLDQWMKEMGCG